MRKRPLKIIAIVLCCLLIFQQSGFAQVAAVELNIAGHFTSLRNVLSADKFRPLHLRSLSYDGLNDNFKLLLDKGDTPTPQAQEVESSAKDLFNYFLVGIALPSDSFWVNLRPDSPDDIIDPLLAQTEVGRILLEADLQLKKDTAQATNPGTSEGREYWNKLYQKAGELYGTQNVNIPALTRPWIVPDEIIIRESTDSAYVYKATLKVMLEQDYLKGNATYSFKDEREKQLNEYSAQIIRENIIPKLTKAINNAKRYAPLRQVYYSLILAQWFKARNQDKNTQYSRRINRKDLTDLQSQTSYSVNSYFNAYKDNFAKGEYNIKEPISTPYGQTIRSYFSGGIAGIAPAVMPAFIGALPVTDPNTSARITSVPAQAGIPQTGNDIGVAIQADDQGNIRDVQRLGSEEEIVRTLSNLGTSQEDGATRAQLLARLDNLKKEKQGTIEPAENIPVPRLLPPHDWRPDLTDPDAREYYWALENAPKLMQEFLAAPDFESCLNILRKMIEGYDLKPLSSRQADLEVFSGLDNAVRLRLLIGQLLASGNYIDPVDRESLEIALRAIAASSPELFELIYTYLKGIESVDVNSKTEMKFPAWEQNGTMYFREGLYGGAEYVAGIILHEFMHALLDQKGGVGASGAVGEALAIKLELEFAISRSQLIFSMYKHPSQDIGEELLSELALEHDQELQRLRSAIDQDAHDREHWGPNQDNLARAIIAAGKGEVDLPILQPDGFSIKPKPLILGPEDTDYLKLSRIAMSVQSAEQIMQPPAVSMRKVDIKALGSNIHEATQLLREDTKSADTREVREILDNAARLLLSAQGYENSLLADDRSALDRARDYLKRHREANDFELRVQEAARRNNRPYFEMGDSLFPGGESVHFYNPHITGHATNYEALFDIIFNSSGVLMRNSSLAIYFNKGSEGQFSRVRVSFKPGVVSLVFDLDALLSSGIRFGADAEFATNDPVPLRYLVRESKIHVWYTIQNILEAKGIPFEGETKQKVIRALGYNSEEELRMALGLTEENLETPNANPLTLETVNNEIEVLESRLDSALLKRIPRLGFHVEELGHQPEGNFWYYIFDLDSEYYKGMGTAEFLERLQGAVIRMLNFIPQGTLPEIYILEDTQKRTLFVTDTKPRNDIVTSSHPLGNRSSHRYFFTEGKSSSSEILSELIVRPTISITPQEYADAQNWGNHQASVQALKDPDNLLAKAYLSRLLYKKTLEAVLSLSEADTTAPVDGTGGIDFRFLPIVTQSMDNLKASIRSMPVSSLQRTNLTQEWSDIGRLMNSGITLSAERLKEYFAASCFKGNLNSDAEKIVSCIADILRSQEESCSLTDPTLKDILVVLGSGRSQEELKLAFAK